MRQLLILFLAALPPAAFAAEIQTGITWRECVEIALKNNPDLSAQRNSVEQAKYSYMAGLNSLYPQIGLSHSFSRSGGQAASPSSRWGAGISASEKLFDLRSYSSIRSSRLSFEKAEEDYRDRSASIRQSLSTAFLNLIYAQANLKAQRRIQEIREQNAGLISLKYASGMESRGNMLYSAALAAQAKSDIARAERSVDSARRDLLNAMGSADYVPLTAKDDLALPDEKLELSGIRARIEQIPQIASQKKSLEILKERSLSAKFDALPTLSASQGVSWSGDSEFPGTRSWSFGFSLSLPLFSNGPTYYADNNKAARSALKSGEDSLRSTRQRLENSIVSSYYSYQNAADSARSIDAVLKANDERYEESRIHYQAGQISFIDLENIEQSLVDSQLNRLNYLKNANVAWIGVENLLGVGLGE